MRWLILMIVLSVGFALGRADVSAEVDATRRMQRANMACQRLGEHRPATAIRRGCIEIMPGVWVFDAFWAAEN